MCGWGIVVQFPWIWSIFKVTAVTWVATLAFLVFFGNPRGMVRVTRVTCGGWPGSGSRPSWRHVRRSRHGRIAVDRFLKMRCARNVFAGDAAALVDGEHVSVRSPSMPDRGGASPATTSSAISSALTSIPIEIGSYLTILDLGPWGAVYTEGWDRRAAVSGAVTRQMINYERIYCHARVIPSRFSRLRCRACKLHRGACVKSFALACAVRNVRLAVLSYRDTQDRRRLGCVVPRRNCSYGHRSRSRS